MISTVIGLGNPGHQYENTYHNVGFQAVDFLVNHYDVTFRSHPLGELYQLSEGPVKWLGKPGQYVNRSGIVVKQWCRELDFSPSQTLVIYDDFHLNVGRVKIRPSGGAGGHNGLGNIIEKLNSKEIPRLRIGIGPLPSGMSTPDFVLDKIGNGESEVFRKIYHDLPDLLDTINEKGIETAMNRWNGAQYGG